MYKNNPEETMNRLVTFWKRGMNNQILARFSVKNKYWNKYLKVNNLTSKVDSFQNEEEKCLNELNEYGDYVKERQCLCVDNMRRVLEMEDNKVKIRKDLQDDSLPIAYPTAYFSEHIFGGILGGEMIFEGNDIYTWGHCKNFLIDDWGKFKDIKFDPNNFWIKKIEQCLKYVVANANYKWGVRSFIIINGLNLSLVLRGATKTYLDIYDNPEKLRELMEFGVGFNVKVFDIQRRIIKGYNEKTFIHHEFSKLVWAHDTPLLSVDAYIMCDPEIYENMGLEYDQRIIDFFGGAFMHTHGLGLYRLLPKIVKLKGLLQLELGDDMESGVRVSKESGGIRPFDILKRIKEEITGDIPLLVYCHKDEFVQGLENKSLPGGVLYQVSGIDSPKEANILMKRVKDYSVR